MDCQSLATVLASLCAAVGQEAFQEALALLPLPASAKAEGKRRGPKPLASMSDEELAARAVKKAERVVLKGGGVPAALPEPRPKRVLTPEHLAKLKAGREAYHKAKAGATDALPGATDALPEATDALPKATDALPEAPMPGDWGAIAEGY